MTRALVPTALVFALACAACGGKADVSVPPEPAATTAPQGEGEGTGEAAARKQADVPEVYVDAARRITAHAQGKTRAWDRLAEMVDRFGPRLSGSKALEDAIVWAMDTMARDGLDNARREKVMVPHWVRGKESARVVEPIERDLVILGLGGSVGTKNRPLRAEVAVVQHIDDIAKNADLVKDKIVLINQAMPPYDHEHRESGYGDTVPSRTRGAAEAAKHGAKAVLVRSVTATSLQNPHTGALRYEDGVPKIPAAAVTLEGAELLKRLTKRGRVKVELKMGARTLKDAESANVVAELPGRELRDEYVVIGGHIDSWDVGDGSTDDGAGCVMAMEAALMLKELGLIPRRTIRVVLFTNEENGLRGAKAYYEKHGKETHAAAIEADSGSGPPQGFSVGGTEEQVAELEKFGPLFLDIGAPFIYKGWGGADISVLMKDGVLGLALRPDGSHYFDLHHSPADTIDKINPDHLQRNAAAMALMAFILAER